MSEPYLLKSILSGASKLSDDELAEAYTHITRQYSERETGKELLETPELIPGSSLHDRAQELRSMRRNGQLEGWATGYQRIDQASGGWRRGELIVVGASAAVGKTNFVLNAFHNLAMAKVPCLFISLEMNNVQVYDRLIGLHTTPELGYSEDDTKALPLWYMPTEYNTAELMHEYIRHFTSHAPKIQLVAIDHLSLLPSLHTDRRLSHAAWAQKLREWVKEFDIPIILIHHLRRQAKDNDAPQMVDLAESQDIVNHADQIYLLQRDADDPEKRKYLHVMLKKSRNGGQLHRDVLLLDSHYHLAEVDVKTANRAISAAKSIFNEED